MKIVISDTYSQWATDGGYHHMAHNRFIKNKNYYIELDRKVRWLKMTDPDLIAAIEAGETDYIPAMKNLFKKMGVNTPDDITIPSKLKVVEVFETFRVDEYDGAEFVVLESTDIINNYFDIEETNQNES